jgi:hypothetical protein
LLLHDLGAGVFLESVGEHPYHQATHGASHAIHVAVIAIGHRTFDVGGGGLEKLQGDVVAVVLILVPGKTQDIVGGGLLGDLGQAFGRGAALGAGRGGDEGPAAGLDGVLQDGPQAFVDAGNLGGHFHGLDHGHTLVLGRILRLGFIRERRGACR